MMRRKKTFEPHIRELEFSADITHDEIKTKIKRFDNTFTGMTFPFTLQFDDATIREVSSLYQTSNMYLNNAKISKIQLQILKKTEYYETFPNILKNNEVNGEIKFTKARRMAFWKWALHYVNPEIEIHDIQEPGTNELFYALESDKPGQFHTHIHYLRPGNDINDLDKLDDYQITTLNVSAISYALCDYLLKKKIDIYNYGWTQLCLMPKKFIPEISNIFYDIFYDIPKIHVEFPYSASISAERYENIAFWNTNNDMVISLGDYNLKIAELPALKLVTTKEAKKVDAYITNIYEENINNNQNDRVYEIRFKNDVDKVMFLLLYGNG